MGDVTDAERLARRLAALPERVMRAAIVAEVIRGGEAALTARVLDAIVTRGRRGGPPYDVASLAIAGALGDAPALGYDALGTLYAAAKEGGHVALATLLLSAAGDGAPPAEPERALTPRGRPLTLGERKMLARRPGRELLDRLLRDVDPQVIHALLDNPRLVERDVVFLAARRPTSHELQRELFRSRWAARYPVRLALARNPHTPGDLAVRLLPCLAPGDLATLAGDPALPPPRREAARLLGGLGR